jgi:monoamine oxidase
MIKLSTKIKKINAANGADGKVVVTTEKGDALQFDEIVVTAPLGWLKQNQEAFTPSLPPRFSSAIDSIGYGCLEKVRTLLSWMLRGRL